MTFKEYKQTDEASNLLAKLKRKLKNRGFDLEEVSDEDLYDEIEDAITSVNGARNFISTETELFEKKYNSIVIRLAICSFSKMGAEGELAHSEKGISRTYTNSSEYPKDILKEIVPLGRVKSL